MEGAWVLRLLPGDLFQDGRSLQLLGVRLVAGRCSLIQRQRVKDLSLRIGRILLREPSHHFLVAEGPSVLVHGLSLPIELGGSRKVIALAFRLGAGLQPLLHGGEPVAQRLGRAVAGEGVVPEAERDSPIGDDAPRIVFENAAKGLDGLREFEGVQQRHCSIEPLCNLGRTRRLEVYRPQLFGRGAGMAMAGSGVARP